MVTQTYSELQNNIAQWLATREQLQLQIEEAENAIRAMCIIDSLAVVREATPETDPGYDDLCQEQGTDAPIVYDWWRVRCMLPELLDHLDTDGLKVYYYLRLKGPQTKKALISLTGLSMSKLKTRLRQLDPFVGEVGTSGRAKLYGCIQGSEQAPAAVEAVAEPAAVEAVVTPEPAPAAVEAVVTPEPVAVEAVAEPAAVEVEAVVAPEPEPEPEELDPIEQELMILSQIPTLETYDGTSSLESDHWCLTGDFQPAKDWRKLGMNVQEAGGVLLDNLFRRDNEKAVSLGFFKARPDEAISLGFFKVGGAEYFTREQLDEILLTRIGTGELWVEDVDGSPISTHSLGMALWFDDGVDHKTGRNTHSYCICRNGGPLALPPVDDDELTEDDVLVGTDQIQANPAVDDEPIELTEDDFLVGDDPDMVLVYDEDEVEPAAAEPTEVEPAAAEPAEVEPVEVEPTVVEPAEVEPVEVEPTVVEPAAEQQEPLPFIGSTGSLEILGLLDPKLNYYPETNWTEQSDNLPGFLFEVIRDYFLNRGVHEIELGALKLLAADYFNREDLEEGLALLLEDDILQVKARGMSEVNLKALEDALWEDSGLDPDGRNTHTLYYFTL